MTLADELPAAEHVKLIRHSLSQWANTCGKEPTDAVGVATAFAELMRLLTANEVERALDEISRADLRVGTKVRDVVRQFQRSAEIQQQLWSASLGNSLVIWNWQWVLADVERIENTLRDCEQQLLGQKAGLQNEPDPDDLGDKLATIESLGKARRQDPTLAMKILTVLSTTREGVSWTRQELAYVLERHEDTVVGRLTADLLPRDLVRYEGESPQRWAATPSGRGVVDAWATESPLEHKLINENARKTAKHRGYFT